MKEQNNTIYINARFLTQPITGVQRFAIEICKELIKLDLQIQFVSPPNILHIDLADEFDVKIVGKQKGHYWEQIELPFFLKKNGSPILLNLCNTAPLFYQNCYITVHDLAFLKHPEWFSIAFRTFYNFLIPRIAKKAKAIFTVSNTVKADIHAHYKLDSSKVSVIYNGLSSVFVPSSQQSKSTIDNPFFLAIGGKNPRKNLNNTVKAMQMLNREDFELHVICRADENFAKSNIDFSTTKFKTIFHHDVNDEKLKTLYSNASGLLYPSFYEGFGIPPLEAINYNCPVLLSKIDVFEELYHGHAIFIDPNNPNDIKKGILKIINKEFDPITPEELKMINSKYSYINAAKKLQKRIQLNQSNSVV